MRLAEQAEADWGARVTGPMLTGADFPCPPPPPEAPQPPADLSDRAALAAWLSEMGERLALSKGLTHDGAALARAGEMLGACRCEGGRS